MPLDRKSILDRTERVPTKMSLLEIKGSDLITAADKHYRFHTLEEGNCKGKVVLKSTIDAYDLLLKPDAFQQCEWPTAVSLLKLGQGMTLRDKDKNDTGVRVFRLLPADKTQLSIHFDPSCFMAIIEPGKKDGSGEPSDEIRPWCLSPEPSALGQFSTWPPKPVLCSERMTCPASRSLPSRRQGQLHGQRSTKNGARRKAASASRTPC
jgi:hypothetical protein